MAGNNFWKQFIKRKMLEMTSHQLNGVSTDTQEKINIACTMIE
jgi:hypothetical protein